MTETLRKIPLGPKALDYIRESLADGKKLSRSLLSALDLRSGEVCTYLPPSTTTTATDQFLLGGKLTGSLERRTSASTQVGELTPSAPITNIDSLLVSELQAYLSAGRSAVCIFENAFARPDDPWLAKSKLHTFICEGDVYHFLNEHDVGSEIILLTIKKSKSIRPPLLGIFAHSSLTVDLEHSAVTLAELNNIAGRTEKLVVGAYDGEGFLIWSKI